ncbi:MAG: hypothetical protein GX051_02910 [Clostridiales bacterium]|nr:hypothetical protein [Clostridiales bacterium]
MLCQNCKKNEANTHFKRIINGSTSEIHLCAECAEALGYANAFSGFGLGLGDLFGNLLGYSAMPAHAGATLRCPMCGNSFDDIAKSGKLGCAECYETFYDKLLPSLQRIHGKTKHEGKQANSGTQQVNSPDVADILKEKLSKAVEEQNFEEAARIRDELKKIEKDGEKK